MKQIKKLLALVLALAICAAFALPALADENPKVDEIGTPASDGNFTLTLKNPAENHIYEVYQLLTGNPAKDGEDWVLANVAYSEKTGWKMTKDGEELTAAEAAEEISRKTSQDDIVAFVNGLPYDSMTAITTSANATKKDNGALEWSLPGGYYVIRDITKLEEGSEEVLSGIMVQVVGSVSVSIKPTKPEPDKDVDKTEVVGGPYDFKVGDMIPYVISAKVPAADLVQYVKPGETESKYEITFMDFMPDGLTYLPTEADFKAFYYENGERKEFSNFDRYFTVTTPTAEEGKETPTFEVKMDLFKFIGTKASEWSKYQNDDKYIVIEITYKARLDKIEQVETGVKNQVKLKYPNNPGDSSQTGSSVSPPAEVPVYSFTLDGTKVDKDDSTKLLSGAVFELYDANDDKSAAAGDPIPFVVEDGGKLIRWTNTRYSEIKTEGSGENERKYVYKITGYTEDGDNKTANYEQKKDGTGNKEYNVVTTVTSADTTGKFAFGGLAAGTYFLREIKAPAGYNKIETDIKVEIIADFTETTDENGKKVINVIVKHKVNDGDAEGGSAITVENGKGSTLPSTGGIGTTIFYVVGAVLVVGAGVLLFTKRRIKN